MSLGCESTLVTSTRIQHFNLQPSFGQRWLSAATFEPHEYNLPLHPTWTSCSSHYHRAYWQTGDSESWRWTESQAKMWVCVSSNTPCPEFISQAQTLVRLWTTSGRCVGAAVQRLCSQAKGSSLSCPVIYLCEGTAGGHLQKTPTSDAIGEMLQQNYQTQKNIVIFYYDYLPFYRLATTLSILAEPLFLQNPLRKLSLSWPLDTFKAFKN